AASVSLLHVLRHRHHMIGRFAMLSCVGTAALVVSWATLIITLGGVYFLIPRPCSSNDANCERYTADYVVSIGLGVILLIVGCLLGWLSFVLGARWFAACAP